MLAVQKQSLSLAAKPLVLRAGTVGLSFVAKRSLSVAARSAVPQHSAARRIRQQHRTLPVLSQPALPRALFFQTGFLSTQRGQGSYAGKILRAEEKPVVKATEPAKKKTLMDKIKHEALHYWHGTKLFAKEVKLSSKLVTKVAWGGTLTRREQRQLRRTFSDTVRLVPFLMFVIIPFAELLLPVALKLFPGMLPSTYEDKASMEKKREKTQRVRNELTRYLKETLAEQSKVQQRLAQEGSEETGEFLARMRSSGEQVSTSDLLKVAHVFEDELTLDNLSRPQLVSIARFVGVNAFGTDNYLKYQINNRMRYIRADDKMIKAETIESLSVPELQSACQARGIRILGVSPARMREELAQWLELHLDHNIPATLLILSRIITAGEPESQKFSAEALQATITSLPDNLVNEATLRLAEVSGTATKKQKLEVLEEQEELIEDEDVQEKKKQQQDKKEEEEAKTVEEPKAEAAEAPKAEEAAAKAESSEAKPKDSGSN